MSDFEELLKADRARLEQLQVPQDMEERLRQALRRHVDGIQPVKGEVTGTSEQDSRSQRVGRLRSRSFRYKVIAASILVLFALTAFNFDAIASGQELGHGAHPQEGSAAEDQARRGDR